MMYTHKENRSQSLQRVVLRPCHSNLLLACYIIVLYLISQPESTGHLKKYRKAQPCRAQCVWACGQEGTVTNESC